jgi:hypothetical protein
MRVAICKDCQREVDRLKHKLDGATSKAEANKYRKALAERPSTAFTYSEHSANGVLDRGGSRSDRCPEHRQKHRSNIQGMAVAYVDLQTVGVAVGADDPDGPTGPFGGLGPLPGGHNKDPRSADLSEYEFGMVDEDIVKILELLRTHRVVVLKAGTGTGKSTFCPYRLMDPPSKLDLERLGILDKLRKADPRQTRQGTPLRVPRKHTLWRSKQHASRVAEGTSMAL